MNANFLKNTPFLLLFVGSTAIIPFLYSNQLLDPSLNIKLLGFSLLIPLYFIYKTIITKNLPTQNYQSLLKPYFILFILYIFALLFSSTLAINKGEAINEITKYTALLFFTLFIFNELKTNQWVINFTIKSIVIIALITSLASIAQYNELAFNNINGWAGPFPFLTFSNPNLLASWLLTLIPITLYALFTLKESWRFISVVTLTLCFLTLWHIQCDSVNLSLKISASIALLIFFLIKIPTIQQHSRSILKPKQLIITLLTAIILYFGTFQIYIKYLAPVETTTQNLSKQPLQASWKQRLILWQKTTQLIKDQPILGVGAGNWKIIIPTYQLQDGFSDQANLYYTRSYNEILTAFAEVGILAGILFFCLYFIPILFAIKIFALNKNNPKGYLALALLAASIAKIIDSSFGFPYERIEIAAAHQLNTALILALLYPIPSKIRKITTKIPLTILFTTIFILFSAFFIYFSLSRYKSEKGFRIILYAHSKKNWDEMKNQIDNNFTPLASLTPSSVPLYWYRGIASASQFSPQESLEDFQKAYQNHPNNLAVLNNLASAYLLTGNYGQAIQFYQKALQISPTYQDALLNLGVAYFNLKNYPLAYKTFNKCNQQNPKTKQFLAKTKQNLYQLKDSIP